MFVQVEIFSQFADVYLIERGGGPLLRQFHTAEFRKAFRKKAKKFAARIARKVGNADVRITDHTKKEVPDEERKEAA